MTEKKLLERLEESLKNKIEGSWNQAAIMLEFDKFRKELRKEAVDMKLPSDYGKRIKAIPLKKLVGEEK